MISASSTKVKQENQEKQNSIDSINREIFIPSGNVQVKTKKDMSDVVYTIFACLYCKLVKTNIPTGLWF